MANLQQLLVAEAARQKLRAISGVERIGFGLKEKDGQVLPEYVFRVYVRRKKPLSDLTPEEVIPAEIDGIKTDVVLLQETESHCRTNLTPGKQITREIPNYSEGSGTLGCIVRKGTGTYILTNQHVIVPEFTYSSSNDVYQPKHSTCAGCSCNSPVARVVSEASPWAVHGVNPMEGKSFWLDCGLLEINEGVARSNTIDGIGTLNAQIRDLASEPGTPASPAGTVLPSSPISIHKRGARTDVTHGTVVEFCHEQTLRGSTHPVILWEIVILPGAGVHYSETYRISADSEHSLTDILGTYAGEPVTATRVSPGDASDRRIHFEGTVFSLEGDSGSICVDDTQKASGLLYAGRGLKLKVEGENDLIFVPSGRSVACYIRPVFLSLGLDVASAIVVASSPASGPVVVMPGDALTTGIEPGGGLTEEMARFESMLQTTAAGRHVLNLFRDHHREVFDLINRRRRVTVAWQRGKGPAFVAAFLNLIRSDEREIPKQVAGHSIEDLIEQMLAALQQEGSARLRQAIEEEREFVSLLLSRCESFDHLFEFFREERFAGAQMQP